MNSVELDIVTILKGYLNKDYSFSINSNLNDIYVLANKLCITPIIGYTLNKNDKYVSNIFDKVLFNASLKHEVQKNLRNNIKDIFEDNDIDFVFIKGLSLAKYYDEPYLRYSGDIDVVVKKDKYIFARDVLVENAKFYMKFYLDDEMLLINNNGYDVDLHCAFTKIDDAKEEFYKDVVSNNINHELDNELLLFHICNHSAKHMNAGYISLQFLIDLYYVNKLEMDRDKVERMFRDAGLWTFYERSLKLIDVLFFNKEMDEISRLYVEFLFNGSNVIGRSNKVRVGRAKNNDNKFIYLCKRAFPTYKYMSTQYRILLKKKYLLPIYYFVRFYDIISTNRIKAASAEVKYCITDNDEDTSLTRKLFNSLGI